MALTDEQRKALRIALGSRGIAGNEADAIADAIDNGGNAQGVAVADIADTSVATAEDVGDKVNELLTSLRDAGIIAAS